MKEGSLNSIRRSFRKEEVYVPITNKVIQVQAKSESLQMAIDITQKIKNQNQQLIREKVANVQKRIQEQKAEQRRKNLTNDVVQTVEKQVEYQDAVANKFLEKFGGSQKLGASGKSRKKSKDDGGHPKQEAPSS